MDVMQGTLEMLVLRTLILEPLHGYAIAKSLQTASNGQLEIEFGSLYPALKRLEMKGWANSAWETSDNNRRAKVYRLTPEGKRQLRKEHSDWAAFVNAVTAIMGPLPKGNG
jgi:PadR family transcriptional regulator PadR